MSTQPWARAARLAASPPGSGSERVLRPPASRTPLWEYGGVLYFALKSRCVQGEGNHYVSSVTEIGGLLSFCKQLVANAGYCRTGSCLASLESPPGAAL